MVKDRMAERSDDMRELIGLGATDHGELNPLVMVLQKVCDVGLVGDRVDVHVGVALLPLVDHAVETFASTVEGSALADGKHWGVT